MGGRIAVVYGLRTPLCKAGGALKNISADDIGALLLREIITKMPINKSEIDELIVGNVATPHHAANIARVIGIKGGLDLKTPAFTVSRNCASGMEAISNAIIRINGGYGKFYISMGVESMSNIPLLFNKDMTNFFGNLFKAKSTIQKISAFTSFRPSFLKPIIGINLGLTDPTCNLIMGKTAENLVRDFSISRSEQDQFALRSHNLAEKATKDGILSQEILPICSDYKTGKFVKDDDGIRFGQTIEALAKLKPFFEKPYGTVTVGNSSQITDGACGLVLTSEEHAKQQNLPILGYIKDFAYAGLDQTRMGLGPVFSSYKLLKKLKMKMTDIDIFEINEAFSSQVLGCLRAFDSRDFFAKHFNEDQTLGSVPMEKLNVNGGAIALGHPVGVSGARLILHILKEMNRKNLQTGLASICIGGGQGGAFLLERS